MAYDQNTVSALYKKLLNFYPREFKEQLEESMQQTFNDLYNEKKYKTKRGLFSFVLWTFGETITEIIQEHILLFTQGDTMKNIFTNFKSPAIIGLLFVIPFMIMEVVNTQNFNAVFNIPLFGIMWLLPTIFIMILVPIVRNVQAGNNMMANPINLLLRVVFLVLIAWMWTGALIDQMPCFLGVPNCD
jgi:hypothetical protein